MAVPVEMPFGLRTRVGPRNHVLDGGLDPPWEGAILGKGWVIVKLATLQKWLNRSRCRLRYGLGPRKHVLDGVQIPHATWQFLGERTCPDMSVDTVVSCAKTAEPTETLFGL